MSKFGGGGGGEQVINFEVLYFNLTDLKQSKSDRQVPFVVVLLLQLAFDVVVNKRLSVLPLFVILLLLLLLLLLL